MESAGNGSGDGGFVFFPLIDMDQRQLPAMAFRSSYRHLGSAYPPLRSLPVAVDV
jgi:hypothetical protein